MNIVKIHSEIIRKLAHSGLKTLDSLSDLLKFYEIDSEGGLHDTETRKLFYRSIQAFSQAIRDLQLLAVCSESSPESWITINWKKLIKSHLSSASSKTISFQSDESDYEGKGQGNLLNPAMGNMVWFIKCFCNGLAKVHLSTFDKNGVAWIRLLWETDGNFPFDSDFSSFRPFYPMMPKESLALYNSTGLALFTVKHILELHGGNLMAQKILNHLKIEWECPKITHTTNKLEDRK